MSGINISQFFFAEVSIHQNRHRYIFLKKSDPKNDKISQFFPKIIQFFPKKVFSKNQIFCLRI